MDDEYTAFMQSIREEEQRAEAAKLNRKRKGGAQAQPARTAQPSQPVKQAAKEEDEDEDEEDFLDEEEDLELAQMAQQSYEEERRQRLVDRYAAYRQTAMPAQDVEEEEEDEEEEEAAKKKTKTAESQPISSVQTATTSVQAMQAAGQVITMNDQGKYVYTDADGVSYEYDEEKHAWFPMWREDLIESQQAAYGAYQAETSQATTSQAATSQQQKPKDDSKKGKNKQQNEQRQGTVVYVTGLPLDIEPEEVHAYFSKCGIIAEDLDTGKPKIKLYRDEQGNLKGDGWVAYFKPQSVPLALQYLDDSDIRPGHRIHVTEATFQSKEKGEGGQDKKRKVDKKKVKAKLQKLQKKLEWFDEEQTSSKYTRIVILKHMFAPEEIESDPGLIIDLKQDIRDECERLGEVTAVNVYDRHPEGVCSVKFKTEEDAYKCVQMMHGRFFGGRQIEAFIHDGKIKYDQVRESESEQQARLKRYGDWLEGKAKQESGDQQSEAQSKEETKEKSASPNLDED